MRAATPIGLVGCGAWGKFILRDLAALGCDVTVVARSSRSRASAESAGATRLVRTFADLPAVEGIVVATPTATHAAVVAEALERGVPLFVEKPLTDDPAAANSIPTAAPNRVFVMDKWRYHPGVELAAIAREAELGAVLGVRTTRIGWGNPHDVDAIWILAPHDLAIGLEILGTLPEAKSAVAEGRAGSATGLVGLLGDSPWLALDVSSRAIERRREVALVCEEGVAVLPDGYSEEIATFRHRRCTSTPLRAGLRGLPDGHRRARRARSGPLSAILGAGRAPDRCRSPVPPGRAG